MNMILREISGNIYLHLTLSTPLDRSPDRSSPDAGSVDKQATNAAISHPENCGTIGLVR
jgi:type I restriction-modification system DNA methylase subunit